MADINNLRTLDQLRGKVRELFTNEQIMELVNTNSIPHYILHNPISKESTVLFNSTILKEFIEETYLKEEKRFAFRQPSF